jgi:Ca2+-transporting ATPase
LCTAGTENF